MTSFKLIVGKKELNQGIADYSKGGKALDLQAHKLAVSIVAHSYQHGEVSLVNKLIGAMPKSSRSNSMRKFMETFAPAVWNSKDKLFVVSKKKLDEVKANDSLKDILEEAIEKPFFTDAFGKEQAYIPVNLNTLIKMAIRKAEKRLAEGTSDKDHIELEQLNKLRAIVKADDAVAA